MLQASVRRRSGVLWVRQALDDCVALSSLVITGPFALLTSRAGQAFLLAVILVELPLRIDKNFLYRDSASRVGALYGVNISLMTLAISGLWLGWVIGHLLGRPPFRIRWHDIAPLGAYLLVVAGSVLVARDKGLWLFEVTLLVQVWLVYVWLAHWIVSRRHLLFVIATLLVGFLVESVIIVGNVDFTVAGISSQVHAQDVLTRSGGTLPLDNAGSYIALLLPLAVALCVAPLPRAYRVLGVSAFGIGMAALVRTGVRGAWIAFAVSLGCMFVSQPRAWRIPRTRLISLAIILVCIIALFSTQIATRVSVDEWGTASARIPLMRIAARMIAAHPVLGVGANNFAIALEESARTEQWGMWVWVVHDKYLLVWAETGILGLLTFLFPLFIALRQGVHSMRASDVATNLIVAAVTASLVGRLVMMLSQPFHNRSELLGLWCLLAIQLAVFRYTGAREMHLSGARIVTYQDRINAL